MPVVKNIARLSAVGFSSLTIVAITPLSVIAQEATPDQTTPADNSVAPAPATESPPQETPKKEKKPPGHYTYNPATGRWETPYWIYDPNTGRYERRPTPPPAPVEAAVSPQSLSADGPPSAIVADAEPGSSFNSNSGAAINQNLTSNALSGDALVYRNTLAGNATSGDAAAIATILNMLQSGASYGGGDMALFTHNIYGDVIGDMMIDPAALAYAQLCDCVSTPDMTVNIASDNTINNNILLNASSGDASVVGNTTAGDATTGNALAMANVVNMINTVIAAQQSFMGMINIYGSLTGDILLPPGALESLLASNAPTVNIDTSDMDGSFLADLNTNSSINNELSATAGSGTATVSGNTNAGNALTGNASSNITVLNLTGRQVIANNSLLVFVNVMGQWVGMIVNAPAGATSAALAGGASQAGCNSGGCGNATDITTNSNNQINNNISVNAQSGDALVHRNTNAGNATSGNAMASINLANIINSNISLSDWFGILFINVFGTWNGSFGIDTAMGNTPAGTSVNPTVQAVQVFSFVPTGANKFSVQSLSSSSSSGESAPAADDGAILAAALGQAGGGGGFGLPTVASANNPDGGFSMTMPALGGFLALLLLGADRYRNGHTKKTIADYSSKKK